MSATATAQIEKTIWQAELENPDQQKIIVTLKTRRENRTPPPKACCNSGRKANRKTPSQYN